MTGTTYREPVRAATVGGIGHYDDVFYLRCRCIWVFRGTQNLTTAGRSTWTAPVFVRRRASIASDSRTRTSCEPSGKVSSTVAGRGFKAPASVLACAARRAARSLAAVLTRRVGGHSVRLHEP